MESKRTLRILLEMRPALDGHAGIPQETRLLLRGLQAIDGIKAAGMIQSGGHVLAKGLPANSEHAHALPLHKQIDRLARVVISVKQSTANPHFAIARMVLRQLTGRAEELNRFDPTHFNDFIWRALFAKTLHVADFNSVTTAEYRIARIPWRAMHGMGLVTRHLFGPMYPKLDTSEFDIMIAETPYPGHVASGTKMVVRYHDAIPMLMPHTISDRKYHQASHYLALKCNVRTGAYFACVSEATRRDLLSVFPEAESRSVTIHNMISDHYYDEDSDATRVAEIVSTRESALARPNGNKPSFSRVTVSAPIISDYMLMVSTIEPRKNHAALLSAWEHLRSVDHPGLKLVVVGMAGWDHEDTLKKFRPWIERRELFFLEDVPSPELRLLYKHARATVCPSFYEGFDFSGVEAMSCGGAVVASDIRVHREIYQDAAEFFNPYSTSELVSAIEAVISPSDASRERRKSLQAKGAKIASQYRSNVILPRWQDFLHSIR